MNNYRPSTQIKNLSGLSNREALAYLPEYIPAERIFLFPDLNRGKAILPSGSTTIINTDKVKNWRKYVIFDIGCGMRLVKSDMHYDEFVYSKKKWNQVYNVVKENLGKSIGDLGTGNHFLDAAIDSDNIVYFLCHTGCPSGMRHVDNMINSPDEFDDLFEDKLKMAELNRCKILDFVKNTYSDNKFKTLLDRNHNHFEKAGNNVIIRKGTVKVNQGDISIIPSSLNGKMAIIKANTNINEISNSISHGTGRKNQRKLSTKSKNYNPKKLREDLIIPDEINDEDIAIESPEQYRSIYECIKPLRFYIQVQKLLKPIAYIGQVTHFEKTNKKCYN